MIVAGVDPSLTSAGIAVLRNGKPVMLTCVGSSTPAAKWPDRVRRITAQAAAITRTIEAKVGHPDLIVVEAPLTIEGPNQISAYDRYCVFVGICSQFLAWGVPFVAVNNQTRAKWATGKGNAKKADVLAAVKLTWAPWQHHIRNHDIADSLTLAECGARHVGDELHFSPRRRHIEALTTIDWPQFRAQNRKHCR